MYQGKKKHSGQKGFTMIELILVITVLGILAVMALPSFYDVSSSAKSSARDGVIGAVKGGINMLRANNMTSGTSPYAPATLDVAVLGPCSTTNRCFEGPNVGGGVVVLQDPVTSANWCAAGAGVYRWAPTSFAAGACAATAGTTTTCTYTPGATNAPGEGAFNCVAD